MNRYFTKELTWMTKEHMKRCSAFLVIREIQIKSSMRYHYTSGFYKKTILIVGEDAEQQEPSYIASRNAKWKESLGKRVSVSYKVKHSFTYDPKSLLLGIYPRDMKSYVPQNFLYKHL